MGQERAATGDVADGDRRETVTVRAVVFVEAGDDAPACPLTRVRIFREAGLGEGGVPSAQDAAIVEGVGREELPPGRPGAAEGHLQPTALVHEAYLRLIRTQSGWKSRAHFCAIAATAMRQILLNHAAAKRAAKRTPRGAEVLLDDLSTPSLTPSVDLLALDEALTKLKEIDEDDSGLVELRFFAGLTIEEIAKLKEVSTRTIEKRWRRIRAWLNRELTSSDSA